MKYNFLKSSYDRLLYSVFKHMEEGNEYYFSFAGIFPKITINDEVIGGLNINQSHNGKTPAVLEVYDTYGNEIPVTTMEYWDKLEQAIIDAKIKL